MRTVIVDHGGGEGRGGKEISPYISIPPSEAFLAKREKEEKLNSG